MGFILHVSMGILVLKMAAVFMMRTDAHKPMMNCTFTGQPIFSDDQSSHRSFGPAIGMAVTLECPVTGDPTPEITWLKDGHVIQSDVNLVIQENGAVLLIRRLSDSDAGNYECEASNGIGEVLRRTFTVGEFLNVLLVIS